MNYIGTQEVIRILGIKLPTLYAWVQRGKLNPRKVGKLLRFDEEEVRAMIVARSVQAWILRGGLRSAREKARGHLAERAPDYRLTYLEPPKPDEACVRIDVFDAGRRAWVAATDVSGIEAAVKGDAWLFLGTLDPWKVKDVRPEESGGRSYWAAWIEKVGETGEAELSDVLKRLDEGVIVGKLEPWTRDDVHERGRR